MKATASPSALCWAFPDFPVGWGWRYRPEYHPTGATRPQCQRYFTGQCGGLIGVNLLGSYAPNSISTSGTGMQEVLNTTIDLQSPFDLGLPGQQQADCGHWATRP